MPELDDGGDDIHHQGQPSEADCDTEYDHQVEVMLWVIQRITDNALKALNCFNVEDECKC